MRESSLASVANKFCVALRTRTVGTCQTNVERVGGEGRRLLGGLLGRHGVSCWVRMVCAGGSKNLT